MLNKVLQQSLSTKSGKNENGKQKMVKLSTKQVKTGTIQSNTNKINRH